MYLYVSFACDFVDVSTVFVRSVLLPSTRNQSDVLCAMSRLWEFLTLPKVCIFFVCFKL